MRFDKMDYLIGKLFIIGFNGRTAEEDFLPRYRRIPAAGVILFGRNLGDPDQIRSLTAAIEAAGEEAHGIPPFIGIDQEGGNLSPLRGSVASLPGNMGLAATGEISAAHYAGRKTAEDLRELGFNLVFAPVLDLATNPANPVIGTRAFSDDPEIVAAFGEAFARGLMEGGLAFTAKHFPGHGSCREDSHVTLPFSTVARASLWEKDLRPFKEVLGLPGASVMTAHVRYAALDPENPATLSAKIIHDLLRGEMGFAGVVITDDLEMGAIRGLWPPAEAAVKAIEAGADLVLICHTFADQLAAFEAVKTAVTKGRLSMDRIEESVDRLARWRGRSRSSMQGGRFTVAAEWTPLTLAEKVVTFVGEPSGWPFDRSPLAVIEPEYRAATPAETPADLGSLFAALAEFSVPFAGFRCSLDPDPAEIDALVEAIGAKGCGRLLLVLRRAIHHPGQRLLASRLAALFRLLIVSLDDPREIAFLGEEFSGVCIYSSEPSVLTALARVLCGDLAPQGRPPVRLGCTLECRNLRGRV